LEARVHTFRDFLSCANRPESPKLMFSVPEQFPLAEPLVNSAPLLESISPI
jgi:hypothetical protein